MGGGGWTIDSISMTTNTLKHNNPVLQVPIPFQGLKSPCPYLQITALCKAALSGAICQWPQGREKTEGNRHKQASEKCNGFCWGFSHCCGSVRVSFVYQMYKIHWEIVNIKGLSGAFLVKALDRRFVYDLQQRIRNSWWLFFCISRQSMPLKRDSCSFRFKKLLFSSVLCSSSTSIYHIDWFFVR